MKSEFGSQVFDFSKIEDKLPPAIFKKFRKSVDARRSLDADVAEFLAHEIKEWAEEMGATHFTHWFLPLTGITAGKQETFLKPEDDGRIISSFSGKDLVKGEPDASSFPHGGMRSTFEARGYTAWDPASPVFIEKKGNGALLYIPSVYFGYNGKVLDKKTPLLRSLRLINDVSLKILRHLNQNVGWVKNMIGPEQEFFLINEDDYRARPDLRTVGRAIFAARPPKGQQMGDHYFGEIPEKVLAFYEDLEEEAFKLGIPVKTRHGEVAPNQFEIAPIYEEANIAADHNQMLMEILARTARKHKMFCLFHEKPFKCFNGSGKHINWSLMDSRGRNLLSPGSTRGTRIIFLAFLAGFLDGIKRHNALLQASLASPGNEFRLGGHEAPPSIISVHLGEELQTIINNLECFLSGRLKKAEFMRFESFIPPILHDLSDRNRTSPVAFTGNKFEFRMPGASASIAFPVSVINVLVADGLEKVFDRIKESDDENHILSELSSILKESLDIVFDGDNYDEEWKSEAEKRNLFIPTSVPETVDELKTREAVELFEKYSVLNEDELCARAAIKNELYVKTVEMELRVARYMLRAYVIPAALKNQTMLINAVKDFPEALLKADSSLLDNQHKFIGKFAGKLEKAMEMLSVLDENNEKIKEGTLEEQAEFCANVVRKNIEETALVVEKIEERVDRGVWTIPRITDMLFR